MKRYRRELSIDMVDNKGIVKKTKKTLYYCVLPSSLKQVWGYLVKTGVCFGMKGSLLTELKANLEFLDLNPSCFPKTYLTLYRQICNGRLILNQSRLGLT